MQVDFHWEHADAFYQRIERLNLHGLHFQHVELCERRAWMYLHKVNFAQWCGQVQTGNALHATVNARNKKGLQPESM